jgi:serine protease Do
MSNRKTALLYLVPVVLTSLLVGMVIASRFGLSPSSMAQTTAAPPMNSAPLTGTVSASTFRDIAKNVSPAVVNIRTESRQRTRDLTEFFGGGGGGGDDLFERFFGQPNPNRGQGGQGGQGQGQGQGQGRPRDQLVQAAGTGFIIDKSGLILTNNHVVEGASKIVVYLFGEEADAEGYEARIVGRDPLSDSALIELTQKPTAPLTEIKFGDSAQMQPGDWVLAIGNPFGLDHTVSVGVISGLERPFTVANGRSAQVLQTDAAINPGNSGGPLLNVRGEVIGINTAIYTDSNQRGNIGIGFAVPSNTVRELLPQLRTGKITRGRIGVNVRAIPRDAVDELGLKSRDGALVAAVSPNGAAEKAGMEPGDVITAFNGKNVRNNNELVSLVTATRPGSTVPVRIVRDGKERTINLTVDELDLEVEGNQARAGRNNAAPPDDPEPTVGFGITLQNITPQIARQLRLESNNGAVITSVEPGSAAARAGLNEGDVILRVGRTPVTNRTDAERELGRVASGATAFLRILRDGQETFVPVTKE